MKEKYTLPYLDESLDNTVRAKDLVSRMTVEECVSQMLSSSAKIERLGIPLYHWWNEALHGVARAGLATVFPQAIGLAAMFDDVCLEKMAQAIADEGRAKYNEFQKQKDFGPYKGLTYWSPNINIFRDPRWGRGQETYGEDPYLTGKLGCAFVRGLQRMSGKTMEAAACAKHFAVHSGPEKDRRHFNAIACPRDMAETYLPAFHELCEAGAAGIMTAYNRTNGEPCCASETLQKKLLRDTWGFQGYTTSDCGAVLGIHQEHHLTADGVESAALALKNGCDLNCGVMYGYLLTAWKEGKIREQEIRDSAVRLMTTRIRLGMFDRRTPFDDIPYRVVDCEEHRRLNYEIACRTLVLLKNDGILPLRKEGLREVAVIGPNADSVTALEGNYNGTANQYHTVLEAIREALPQACVRFSRGSHLYEEKLEDPGYPGDGIAEAMVLCSHADVVFLVTGFSKIIEGEDQAGDDLSGDRPDLYLPACQRTLVKAVCRAGKPLVLINLSGSPVDFEEANESANAILQAWYPGAMGGKAVSDLIFGVYSPSGKLPVTFYSAHNSLPPMEDYSMEGRTYKFLREAPLFEFGFGLSYTTFLFDELTVSKSRIVPGENVFCSVRVRNSGSWEAEEAVQLYLRDKEASVRVPRHKLCGIRRIRLCPGEETTVSFQIPAEALKIILEDGSSVFEKGGYTLFAGGCQPGGKSEKLCAPCARAEFRLV